MGVAKLPAAGMSKSKLAPQIQDLIRTIFDIESMKKTMKEFEARIMGGRGEETDRGRGERRGGR